MPTTGATSNLSTLTDALADLENALDPSGPGEYGTFATDIARISGAKIRERTLDRQQSPDGGDIPENRGKYGDKKRSRGLPVGQGLRESEPPAMLDESQTVGSIDVSGNEIVQTYGHDSETARDKGDWFTRGKESQNRPPRPFFELDDEIIDAVMERAKDQVRRVVEG